MCWRMKKPLSFLLPLALLFSNAASAKAPVDLTHANPALWVVKDKDTTIYLFGSVHMLKPGTRWFDDEVKTAFDASDALMLEVVEPDTPEMARQLAALAMARDGKPLTGKLGEPAGKRYTAAMTEYALPWQEWEMFSPWFPGMMLAVAPLGKLGYAAEDGVEATLTRAAKAVGKPIGGLETVGQQLGFFAGLDEPDQIAFLNATVDGLPKADGEFTTLVNSWAAGRPGQLSAQMDDSLKATPRLAQVLLYQRNAAWAQAIKARLDKPGVVFIAVGAGHLSGKGDVQEQLTKLGLKVKRVPHFPDR